MISISLCMIVKNEEDVLKRCLLSAKDIADEIIIVDTGSTDKTKEIAKEFTDNIYDFKWIDDFATARNFSFSKATKEYILWLDADDVILPKDMLALKELKENLDKSTDVVMLRYNSGSDEYGNPLLSYYRERIIKNGRGYKWIGRIHEVIPYYGNVLYKDISITHKKIHLRDPNRNIRIFEKMIEDGEPLDTRQKFYYAREVYYTGDYNKAIEKFNDFLECKDKWIENTISALLDLSTCYKLIKDKENQILTLFKIFYYSTPRAQVCCYIGKFFLDEGSIELAKYWYELALSTKPDLESGGFFEMDYYNFIPYIELCVCYFRLGNVAEAMKYNDLAGSIKPKNTSYLQNKKLFEKYGKVTS